MGLFFICEVSDTIFEILFLPKTPSDHLANHRWSADHSLRNTVLELATQMEVSGHVYASGTVIDIRSWLGGHRIRSEGNVGVPRIACLSFSR
jgi:hypothetical protein